MKNNRPQNMSQLDYLWTTYGSYVVSNEIGTENTIPNTNAIKSYISKVGAGITELDTEETSNNQIKVVGKSPDGTELTSILLDKGTKINAFLRHTITQEDLDNNFGNSIGEEWLLLQTEDNIYAVCIDDLVVRGQESDSIINQTKDGKIVSSVKINNPITNKSVNLKSTSEGIWADLVVNQDSNSKILIVKGEDGIECRFDWGNSSVPVGFKAVNTFDEYLLETPEQGVIYFVKDVKSIYFNGIKFSSVGVDPQEYYKKDEVYNKEQVDTISTDLNSKVDRINTTLTEKITEETTRATNAETDLQSKLDEESQARQDADTQLNTEIANLKSGSSTLQTQLEQEISRVEETINNETSRATAAETTLQNNIDAITNSKGVANGIATLDESGKVYSSQLPSYVDDVIDVYSTLDELSNLKLYLDQEFTNEVTGESGKIYIDQNSNQYRWTGTKFGKIESGGIAEAPTDDLVYGRKNGQWVEIGDKYIVELPNGIFNLNKNSSTEEILAVFGGEEKYIQLVSDLVGKPALCVVSYFTNQDEIPEPVASSKATFNSSIAIFDGYFQATEGDLYQIDLYNSSIVNTLISINYNLATHTAEFYTENLHINEAPTDGAMYLRRNNQWKGIPNFDVIELPKNLFYYNESTPQEKIFAPFGGLESFKQLVKDIRYNNKKYLAFVKGNYDFEVFGVYCHHQENATEGDQYTFMISSGSITRKIYYEIDGGRGEVYYISKNWEDDVPYNVEHGVRELGKWTSLSDLALTKTNTKEYIPTSDYNPSTKKYVDDHTSNTNNPHQVTADQVGLGNVDNTSDLNKPISTATQEALDSITNSIPEQIVTDVQITRDDAMDTNTEHLFLYRRKENKNSGQGQIDYIQLPTASTTKDGLLTHTDKSKIDKISTAGDGTKYLSDNGTYKTIESGGITLLPAAIFELGDNATSEQILTAVGGADAFKQLVTSQVGNPSACGFIIDNDGTMVVPTMFTVYDGQYYMYFVESVLSTPYSNLWIIDYNDNTNNAEFHILPNYMLDVENDGKTYGRKNKDWVEIENYVHPTTPGNLHIPSGGEAGQVLVNNGDGSAEWSNLIDLYSYGVEWDSTVADPNLTRIGNPLLHKSLPVQSQYKGCVANGGVVNYWLDPNDWSKKADGTDSVLDGTDGTVRVHIPKFYGKSGVEGTKRWVRISTIKIDGTWQEIPEMLVDAYRSTVQKDQLGDNHKAVSVVNTTAEFRGGGNREEYDQYLETDPFRTDLGKPRTNIDRATMRTYATNAGSELLCYEYYKWIFYWAWVIEYATLNLQKAYTADLTAEGYHQGGLGDGVTNWNSTDWSKYIGGYYPLTPCGYCNEFGNFTGVKDLVIPETIKNETTTISPHTFSVPRWRGFDNPFGDIQTNLDGIILERTAANQPSSVYTTTDPTAFGDDNTAKGKMTVAGTEIASDGGIKDYDLGETGEIIPSVVGGSATTYMCDQHYCNSILTSLRQLLIGGRAASGGSAGLGYFCSNGGVSNAAADAGFRTLNKVV